MRRKQLPAAGREWLVDLAGPPGRLERFDPGLDVAEVVLPLREFFGAVFLHEQKLHQHPVALRREAVGIEARLAAGMPPGGRVHVVMHEVEPRRPLHDVEIRVAVPHERDAEDDSVRRAIRRAERQEQRAHVHVAKRFPLLHLHEADLLGERLERVVGVWQPRDRLSLDLPLVAGEAAHRPAAVAAHDILHGPGGVARVRRQAIPFHRHPPPLLDRRPLRPAPQRLRPERPELVEDLLVEVGRQIGLLEQELAAPGGIGRGDDRGAAACPGERGGRHEAGPRPQAARRFTLDSGHFHGILAAGHSPACASRRARRVSIDVFPPPSVPWSPPIPFSSPNCA